MFTFMIVSVGRVIREAEIQLVMRFKEEIRRTLFEWILETSVSDTGTAPK